MAEAAKWHTVYDVTDPNCNAEYYEKWKCLDPILREKGWLE